VEYSDRRDVGHGLRDSDVCGTEPPAIGREQVERADHLRPQAHGNGGDGQESVLDRTRSERRPTAQGIFGRIARYGRASPERVETRPLFELELEEFGDAHLFTRAGRVPELARTVGEHDAGGGHVENLHGAFGERKSITSYSSTSVSARVTNASTNCSSRALAQLPRSVRVPQVTSITSW
jgi:hypothetical protein